MSEIESFTLWVFCDQKSAHESGRNALAGQIDWERSAGFDGSVTTRISIQKGYREEHLELQQVPRFPQRRLPDDALNYMSEYTKRTLEAPRLGQRLVIQCKECNLRAEAIEKTLSDVVDKMRLAGKSELPLRSLVTILGQEKSPLI